MMGGVVNIKGCTTAGNAFFTLCLLVFSCISATPTQPCPYRCRCDRLNTVDCSGLALTEVPALSSWPTDATRLLLQKNQIHTLPSSVFLSLSTCNLTHIDLSDNIIDDIQPRAFSGLNNLVLLDLRRNHIQTIVEQAFSGIEGKGAGEKCTVDLRYNNIQVVKENAFAWVKRISLVFGESSEKMMIKQYAFYSMRNIPEIVVAGVQELSIFPRAFTNFEHLGKLEVRDSTINTIHNFTFEGLSEVGGLHVNNCTIKRLETYAFAGIKYAKNQTSTVTPNPRFPGGYFILTKSTFPLLPQDAFRNTNLALVTISDNSMNKIEAYAFRDMANLKSIHIRNNSLGILSTNSLATVTNLEEVILHGNKISTIEANAFRDSGSIGTLSIGHSESVQLTLEPNAFSQLYEVNLFEITNLSKLEIMPNAFQDVIRVSTLRIDNVFLPILRTNAFNGLRLVGSFDISFCNVTTIQPGVFGQESRSRSAINTFDMSKGNNIECDCGIRKVLSQFRSTFSSYRTIRCSRVSESGTTEHIPLDQVPVCAGCALSLSRNIFLMVCTILLIATQT